MAEPAAQAPPPAPAPPSTAVVVASPPPAPLSYRDRLAQFKILEEKRCELIEELLAKLEATEAKLAQTELDLHSEQNVRRTLQSEAAEGKAREDALVQKQSRRPFALVLIDADAEGFLFQDKYLTKKAQGGEALADELMVRTREYLRAQFEDADAMDIIVRVYSNLEGMANFLVKLDKVRNLGQLRAFSTGFCGRISSFDWIDTGVAKEGGAGRKVRENLAFYTSNSHLRHVLVACSPIDLPTSMFTTLPLDKVTLIESLPLPPALTALPIKVTKFASIFVPPPPIKSPKSRDRDRERGRNGPQLQLMQQEDDGNGATWLVIQPDGHHSRSKSQGGALRRKGHSDDDTESLNISIGPNNTVSVDSGRRRRLM
ncbi:hypothetical protein HBI56_170240 [Parastagonospora nodorum]|uniref:DUF7923 domain-containing protein n=1 Tax=Phaeosphaeria nodorum (strain SN15 / ATCC MYA-4574 / FGSC 10173) TaxID=321614 RepID=A0A7U2FAW9_PHANO|nr:hypothetical protein HBH56_245220 [Parastagonospora nodorum]QRD01920.1 hypothetical protein JI435_048930 [Parastagonospora nodorum SN15]KAH3935504.1 hypothetical protein HBH54_034290 [Parastagonospora nodorum]KAH3964062.1 hypothetical protein HBH51_160140 [Parastagonospora nodorum]KAH3989057.1 hypothetical protein HBH52_023480 [Parastagonospora nodorum]